MTSQREYYDIKIAQLKKQIEELKADTYSRWLKSNEYGDWLNSLPFEEQKIINAVEQKKMKAYADRYSDSTYGLMMLFRGENDE